METDEQIAKFKELSELLHVNTKSNRYQENRDNCQEFLIELIKRSDSAVSTDLYKKCFSKSGKATKFGEYLILTVFCLGWLDLYFLSVKDRENFLMADDDINDKFRNTYFAYLVYLYLGDDFLVGNIIENIFSNIGKYELTKSRHTELDRIGKDSIHALAVASYDGIKWLMDKHYGPTHKPRLYLDYPEDKQEPEITTFEIFKRLGTLAKL